MKKIVFGLLLGIACLGGFAFRLEAKILYVKSPAPGGRNTGGSWADAVATISSALARSEKGDQIWIAEGTYRESEIQLKPGVSLYGGFSGSELVLEKRNALVHKTIIHGASKPNPILYGNVEALVEGLHFTGAAYAAVVCQDASPIFRNCVFEFNDGENGGGALCSKGASPLFEQCWFRYNHALSGAAMAIYNASPIIRQCTFEYNTCREDPYTLSGAAVFVSQQSAPRFEACLFQYNQGYFTAGVLSTRQSFPRFIQCVFRWNRSAMFGAGFFSFDSPAELTDCFFTYNRADEAGGALTCKGADVLIQSSTFAFNGLSGKLSKGGGVYIEGGRLQMNRCAFLHNQAGMGGGMLLSRVDNALLNQCRFHGNATLDLAGGVYVFEASRTEFRSCELSNNVSHSAGGGVFVYKGESIRFVDCAIHHNTVLDNLGHGGGVYLYEQPRALFLLCTLFDNRMHNWFSKGGGVFLRGSKVNLDFCVLYNNTAHLGAEVAARRDSQVVLNKCTLFGKGDFYSIGIDCINIRERDATPINPSDLQSLVSTASVQNCLVWNYDFNSLYPIESFDANVYGAQSYGGLPAFTEVNQLGLVNPLGGDFHLRPGSPLIDAGKTSQPIAGIEPVDGDGDGVAIWDVGAFEFIPSHHRASP